MGYLETAVVVYLRIILYPEGFAFPLTPISQEIVMTELWRETATIVMLIGAGVMAGRNAIERFAFFIYSFAIWDIFYYVFLKVLLNWPDSLLTWDVLFLIPITWTGPVIAPVLVSTFMILLAVELIFLKNKFPAFRVNLAEWIGLISGAVVVIVAFCWDYSGFILKNYSLTAAFSLTNKDLFNLNESYVPESFNWLVFGIGMLIIAASMTNLYMRRK